jgi:hypothetical protein
MGLKHKDDILIHAAGALGTPATSCLLRRNVGKLSIMHNGGG